MMMQDPAVSNAMVSFLEPLVQSVLPNATATLVVLNNFTVHLQVKALSLPACLLAGLVLPAFCILWLFTY